VAQDQKKRKWVELLELNVRVLEAFSKHIPREDREL
jgi:hypothetical protein